MSRSRWTTGAAMAALALLAMPAAAGADTIGTLFEPPSFVPGSINGQGGWLKSGGFDAAVVTNSAPVAAVFGAQSLRISNATTSGSFADQTFSAPLVDGAGEPTSVNGGQAGGARQPHFDASFQFMSADPVAVQPGLAITVSPDSGNGGRMSFLRLRDMPNGLAIDFVDVPSPQTDANQHVDFREVEIAQGLDRAVPHSVRISSDFIEGANNDVVKVYVDGQLKITGSSWENYYRNDSENGPTNRVPGVDRLLWRVSSAAQPANQGKGILIDDVSTRSNRVEYTLGSDIGGSVPATLSLSLGTPASLGAFVPGVDRSYDTSMAATVISTAGAAELAVTDPSATATGRLVNGSYALSEPLQARANTSAFASLSTTGTPLSLLTYSGPISNDTVTIGLRQHIGASQALRTGAYSKTLTFTVSTTTP